MLNIKTLSIIASSLIIIGLIGSIVTYKTAAKQESLTEQVAITDVNYIDILARNGKLEIEPTNEQEAKIEIIGFDLKNNFSTHVKDGKLSIIYKEKSKKFFNFNLRFNQMEMKVYIPQKDYELILADAKNGKLLVNGLRSNQISLDSGNGSIQLQNSYADELKLVSANGSITVDSVTSQSVSAEAKNGRMTMNHVEAQTVDLSSKNGKIELKEVKGSLTARAGNGSILLTNDQLDSPIDFEAKNGKIHIKTTQEPENVGIIAQANNGSSKIFGEKTSGVIFGNAETQIQLQANNGKIIVEK